MAPRQKSQRVQVVIKKSDAMNSTKRQSARNKSNTRHRAAARYSPFSVKKEEDDSKDAFNTLNSSSDERDTTSGVSTTRVKAEIKQEDMAKAALHSSLEHIASGYSYLCKRCDITFNSLKTVLNHRQSVHNKHSKIKHINVEPDINDPNDYCKSCESSYPKKHLYRIHLRETHHMILFGRRQTRPTIGIAEKFMDYDLQESNLANLISLI
ncbi:hypothetical protein MBANPS3_001561 [Mucor bainieri]